MQVTVQQLEWLTGGLTQTEKMPDLSYSLPPLGCKTGRALRKAKGSVCSKCYSCKGRYTFANTQNAMKRRYATLSSPTWTRDMTALIYAKGVKWFRWHDSGDIQSERHLRMIVQIAKNLPDVEFWLPTREWKIVHGYLQTAEFPSNLNVRMSSSFVDLSLEEDFGRLKTLFNWTFEYTFFQGKCTFAHVRKYDKTLTTLPVTIREGVTESGFTCLAYHHDPARCLNCRMCWSRKACHVIYPLH